MGGGGVTIETEEEALEYGAPEVADMQLQVGDELVLDPCVPIPWPDIRASDDRPCPRILLDAENVVPASLVSALLDPRLTTTFDHTFQAAYGHEPNDERLAVLGRITRTANSDAVREAEEQARQRARQAAENERKLAQDRMHSDG